MASPPPVVSPFPPTDVKFPSFSPLPPPAREILETQSITSPTPATSLFPPLEISSPPPAPALATSPLSPAAPLSPSLAWPVTTGSTDIAQLPGQGKGGLQPGIIAAIVGGIVLAAVGIFVIFYKRRKRKDAAQNLPTYGPEGPHEQQNVSSLRNDQGPMLPKPSRTPGFAPNAPLSSVSVSSSTKPTSTSTSIDSDQRFRPPSLGISLGNFMSTFTYEELKIATDNFSDANFLGQGGFGYVHKGVLADEKVVAIKQLKAESGQGESEFRAEIEIISRVHHRHLVSLVGYCIFGAERLLVYEFVPNKTLEFHLHGEEGPVSTRMKIALGSARGLAYLHEDCLPKIIHRDIKSANILLDNRFEAKVADFGLAKFFSDTDTHVSTRVKGTIGYLAPEYATSGKLTQKSDVFSFGVLLLELITGFRPSAKINSLDDEGIVDWALPLLTQALVDGKFDAVADSKLQEYNSVEMDRMAACAAASIRHSAKLRPPMSQIVRCLEGNIPLDELNEGITPGHSTIYDLYRYREDMKKFKKIALESVDQGSSDCIRLASDYD